MLDSPRTAHSSNPPHRTVNTTYRPLYAVFLLCLTCNWLCLSPARAQTLASGASAAITAGRAGIAKVVGGEVKVLGAQGVRALATGDAVFPGERLQSGTYGLASIVLRDGTTLVLGNNSQLQIQKFTFDATTASGSMLVELLQGSVRVITGLLSKANPDALQVKTNTLLMGVRGTDFIVEIEPAFAF